ncbi:actin binding protein, partial [Elasticomyces elasticus]
MASLNLSTNGPSIQKSYQSVVNSTPPTGSAGSSPTYGQWAVFSVSAPLASAFQDAGNKESVLKVQSSGEGELVDLIEEFSDGRVLFAFVKIKDSNTGLPKNALIAWCGAGVPERTKGYFSNHLTAVQKLLQGYHVQITARSEQDLSPESIIQKVADASGSKYSAGSAQSGPPPPAATKPAVASKTVFTPTQSAGMPMRPSRRAGADVDADGWGAGAPEVTRRQLEKVEPAYKPTRVNMRELASGQSDTTQDARPGVISGPYKPIGKIDIAEIRRQAKDAGQLKDDRPETVKGSYEPVGKVDIASIKARAQPQQERTPGPEPQEDAPPSFAQRSAAFSQSSSGPERLTSMPKPKVANKFGGGSTFTGTKAPAVSEYGYKAPAAAAPVGTASKSFADERGKTPAQIWAEKKARQGGGAAAGAIGGAAIGAGAGAAAMTAQKSGGWDG